MQSNPLQTFSALCLLDRDGTINVNTGYPHRCDELVLLPKAGAGIRMLNQNNIGVIVVTNQSGIGRGYFPVADMHRFNACIRKELQRFGAHIDLWRFCPHHPAANCGCRKPKTGLIDDIISLERPLFFVGDSYSDMECADSAGALPIALRGTKAAAFPGALPVSDLTDAARLIIEKLNKDT